MMLGNGVLMIFAALVGGLGLWMFLIGGLIPILPGVHWDFQLPGTAEGWARALSHPLIFEMTWVGKDDSAYPVP
jgi:styrene-oxide isomerase